jgi:hypothetical protein
MLQWSGWYYDTFLGLLPCKPGQGEAMSTGKGWRETESSESKFRFYSCCFLEGMIVEGMAA